MTPEKFQEELDKQNQQKAQETDRNTQIQAINKAGIKNVEATNRNTESTAKGLKSVKGKVEVTNPDLAKTQDVGEAVDAIHKLNMTTFMTNKGLPELATNLTTLLDKTKEVQDNYQNQGLTKLSDQLTTLTTKLDTVSKTLSKTQVSVDAKTQKLIDGLSKSINAIDFNPTVNVKAPTTKVIAPSINLDDITIGLGRIEQAIKETQTEDDAEDKIDMEPIISGLQAVQNAITTLRFPTANYVLPFLSSTGKATQITLNSDGSLPTSGGGSGGGGTQYAEGVTTSPATGTVALGRYKNILPTLSDGALNAPSLDINGRLLTSTNVTQIGGQNVSSAATGVQRVGIADSSNNSLTSTASALDINIKSGAIPIGTNAIGTVGTTSAVVNVGQQTTSTTAVQLSSSSTVPTNGIIIEALSSNSSESIFIGGSGVTTSNGYEIQTGASISFTCNLNTLYIISATSTSNKVCWTVV